MPEKEKKRVSGTELLAKLDAERSASRERVAIAKQKTRGVVVLRKRVTAASIVAQIRAFVAANPPPPPEAALNPIIED